MQLNPRILPLCRRCLSPCVRRTLSESTTGPPDESDSTSEVKQHSKLFSPSLPKASFHESTRYVTTASDLNQLFEIPYNKKLSSTFGRDTPESTYASFSDFKGLHPLLLLKLKELGYGKPLPVQRESLKACLEGRDVVIKSITGSGKTLAFVLPILNKLMWSQPANNPQAIIVAPTRELCTQISDVIKSFVGEERVTNLTGGKVRVRTQIDGSRRGGSDILVATPGRVMQIISINLIRPELLKFLVLDEADELLHDVFYKNLRWILDHSSKSKQMIVTSATIPSNLQFIVDRYMKYHTFIDVSSEVVSLPKEIRNKAIIFNSKVFDRVVKWVLKNEHRGCTMVFVKYRERCQPLADYIRTLGYSTRYIHSEISQSARTRVMENFRSGEFEVLVTTDISMRGMDVPECSLVLQIRPDLNTTKFIHRTGRTGRNGTVGTSILLLTDQPDEMEFLQQCSDITQFEYYKYDVTNQAMSHWFHRNCLKATGPLDTKHLTSVLTSQKANQIINELKQKRAQLISKMGDLSADPRSTAVIEEYMPLIRGFAQSAAGAPSPLQKILKFRWTQSLGTKKPEVQSDAVFEIANVCANIGLWYMKRAAKIAATNNYSEADAKEVHTCLRTAAGVFEYALDKVTPHLDSTSLEDWHDCTVGVLTAYKLECTAEAQEVTMARAIELKHKPDLISALAHETSKLFSDADTALREVNTDYVTKWRRYLQVKIKFYAAYARSFQGEYLLTQDKCGDSIRTLREAQKLYKEAQLLCKQYQDADGVSVGEVRPSRHPFFQKLGPIIDLRLQKSERENGFIYYHKIPEDLPDLELKATFGLVAPIPFNMPDVHPIFTDEAYKDFQIPENATPKIHGSDREDLPTAKETPIEGDTKSIKNESGCSIQ